MSLYKVCEWTSLKEPLAMTRLSLSCLSIMKPTGVSLRNVQPDTKVPPDVFKAVKAQAEEIIGQSCPVLG
jgi:hypothetical protein